jgi:hypothetical protein
MDNKGGYKHVVSNEDEYITCNSGCFIFSLDTCITYLKILRTRISNFISFIFKTNEHINQKVNIKSAIKHNIRIEDGDNA